MAEVRIVVKSSGGKQAADEFDIVKKSAGGLGSAIGNVSQIAVGFVIGQGIQKLGGFLFDAAQAAAADEQSMNKLRQAVENSGASFSVLSGALNESIEAAQRHAFTDDQARNSLSLLVAQTGSADEAMRRFALAQDISRGAGVDLETASRLLGKVTAENVEVFKRMGITIGEGATEAEAFAVLQQRFGGQADAYAQSTAGQFEVTKIKMGELKEQIGYALLPVMTQLGDVMVNTAIPAMERTVAYMTTTLGPTLTSIQAQIETEFVPAAQEQFALFSEAARVEWAKFMPYYETEIRPALQAIENRIADLIGFVRENWALIEPIIRVPVEAATLVITHAVNSWLAIFDLVIQLIQGDFSGAWVAVKNLIDAQLQLITGIITLQKDLWVAIFNGLAAALPAIGRGAIEGLKSGMEAAFPVVLGFLQSLPGRMVAAIPGAAGWLWDIGKQVMEGLGNGLVAGAEAVYEKVRGIANSVISAAKGIFGIRSPSQVFLGIGQKIMEGLNSGMIQGWKGVMTHLLTLPPAIASAFLPFSQHYLRAGIDAAAAFNYGFGSTLTSSAGGDGPPIAAPPSGGGSGGGSDLPPFDASGMPTKQKWPDWLPVLNQIIGKPPGAPVSAIVGALNQMFSTKVQLWDAMRPYFEGGRIPFVSTMMSFLRSQGLAFGGGGTVPGPLGAPTLGVLHGGEQVLTPAQQGGNVYQLTYAPTFSTASPVEVQRFLSWIRDGLQGKAAGAWA